MTSASLAYRRRREASPHLNTSIAYFRRQALLSWPYCPRFATLPYFPLETDSRDAASPISLDGEFLAAFGDVARSHACYLMVGAYLADAARRWNAAFLIDPKGHLAVGRTSRAGSTRSFNKIHLCDIQSASANFCESSYFDAGNEYVIWDTPLARIAVLICYDRHFADAWASIVAMGAEVVCVCTTSPVSAEPIFVPQMQAMAFMHSVYVAMANRVGHEVLSTSGTSTEFLGSSCVISPEGHVLAVAAAREPQTSITADLTADLLTEVQNRNQFRERRRLDTYIESIN